MDSVTWRETPDQEHQISIETLEQLHTSEVTAIKLAVCYGYETFEIEGSAKRFPGDKDDPQIGHDLAYARALRSMAARLERRANGLVKHHDDIREMRRTRKKKAAKKKASK